MLKRSTVRRWKFFPVCGQRLFWGIRSSNGFSPYTGKPAKESFLKTINHSIFPDFKNEDGILFCCNIHRGFPEQRGGE